MRLSTSKLLVQCYSQAVYCDIFELRSPELNRIWCELLIVLFKMNEALQEMRRK